MGGQRSYDPGKVAENYNGGPQTRAGCPDTLLGAVGP